MKEDRTEVVTVDSFGGKIKFKDVESGQSGEERFTSVRRDET